MIGVAIVNSAKRVTDSQVQMMAIACGIQAARDFAPAWGMTPVPVLFYADPTKIPAGMPTIAVVDDPDQSGALGWHAENGDVPDGFIFCSPVLDNGGVALAGSDNVTSIASVLSHEVLELLGDPDVNRWADGPPIPQGTCYSLEMCDPVEDVSYSIDIGDQAHTIVTVSDFVLPAWFDTENTKGPWSFKGAAPGPFQKTPGGYFVVRSSPGSEQQVFGWRAPAWKQALKKKFGRAGLRMQ